MQRLLLADSRCCRSRRSVFHAAAFAQCQSEAARRPELELAQRARKAKPVIPAFL